MRWKPNRFRFFEDLREEMNDEPEDTPYLLVLAIVLALAPIWPAVVAIGLVNFIELFFIN